MCDEPDQVSHSQTRESFPSSCCTAFCVQLRAYVKKLHYDACMGCPILLILLTTVSIASGSKRAFCNMTDLPQCRELVDALSVEHAKALFRMMTDPSKVGELCRALKHRIRADADAAIARHLRLSSVPKSSAYAVPGQTDSTVPVDSPGFSSSSSSLPPSSFPLSPPLSSPPLPSPCFSSFLPSSPPLPSPLSSPLPSFPLPPLPPPPFPPPLSPPPLPPPPFPPPSSLPVSSLSSSVPPSPSLPAASPPPLPSFPSSSPSSSASPVVVVWSSGTMHHVAPTEPEAAAMPSRPNITPDVRNSRSTPARLNQDISLGPTTREIDPFSREALPRRRRRLRHSALGSHWAWTDAMIRERSRSRSDSPRSPVSHLS